MNCDHLAAGCQPGSWVMAKFFYVTQIEALKNNFTHRVLVWDLYMVSILLVSVYWMFLYDFSSLRVLKQVYML